VKRIIVFSEQRTGSNFLLSQLGQHPDFVNCAELLNPANPSRAPNALTWNEFSELRRNDPVKLVTEYVFNESGWDRANLNIVFKFQYQNVFSKVGARVFDEIVRRFPDTYVIHLIRDNAFDRLVSKLNAEKTGQYFARVGVETKRLPNPYRVEHILAERMMRQYLRRIESVRAKLKALPVRIELTYEQLQADAEKTFAEIFRFLGEEPVETVPVSQKQSIDARFQVKNYEFLLKYFTGTEFERFFDRGPGY